MATVLIGGGSGMIGTRLSQLLRERNYEVLHLSRRERPDSEYETFQWDIAAGSIDAEAIDRADFIINLAGAGIADKPWTDRRKQLIIDSRVQTTRLFKNQLMQRDKKPEAFLSSAAIGIYGDKGNEVVDELSEPGEGFLTESCQAWENAVEEVRETGVRTVAFRIGIVLSTQGGALPKLKMSLPFFIAPYFGDGQQWYSWIHIDDVCRCFIHGIENKALTGRYNAVAPNPATNKTLMRKLKEAADQPALLMPVPAFLLRLVLGEMADTVLDSARVSSQKIQNTGFEFNFEELRPALEDLLERNV